MGFDLIYFIYILANIVYQTPVLYRRSNVYFAKQGIDKIPLEMPYDNLTYLSPIYTEDPYLLLQMAEESYVLALNVTYSDSGKFYSHYIK